MNNKNAVINNDMKIKFRFEKSVDVYCICKMEISTFQNFEKKIQLWNVLYVPLNEIRTVICNEGK